MFSYVDSFVLDAVRGLCSSMHLTTTANRAQRRNVCYDSLCCFYIAHHVMCCDVYIPVPSKSYIRWKSQPHQVSYSQFPILQDNEMDTVVVDQTKFSSLALLLLCSSIGFGLAWSWSRPTKGLCTAESTKYPDGPPPLPFFGNIFSFSSLKKRPDQELLTLARKYGQMCMLWLGPAP